MDLSVFFLVPFTIESMPPEWALVGVSLVITPTIRAFEQVRAWIALLSLKMWRVHLLVHFAAPPEFLVIFGFVWIIALDILGAFDSVRKGCMSPPLAVFALGHAQVHVRLSNSSDIPANIKVPIDEALSFASTLVIPNVNTDN